MSLILTSIDVVQKSIHFASEWDFLNWEKDQEVPPPIQMVAHHPHADHGGRAVVLEQTRKVFCPNS